MIELRKKVSSVIDEYAAGYENEPVLRALVQLFPLGGPTDFLLGWKATSIYRQRIEELLNTLVAQLAAVEQNSLSRDFIESEDFFAVFVSSLEIAARAVSARKRRHVAQFLFGTIRNGRTHDLSEQIAEDLRVLQDFHLTVLTSIPRSLIPNVLRPNSNDKVIDSHKLREMTGFDWPIFNTAMSDIERLGFIKHSSEATGWEDGDWQVGRPTHYLKIFNAAICDTVPPKDEASNGSSPT